MPSLAHVVEYNNWVMAWNRLESTCAGIAGESG